MQKGEVLQIKLSWIHDIVNTSNKLMVIWHSITVIKEMHMFLCGFYIV